MQLFHAQSCIWLLPCLLTNHFSTTLKLNWFNFILSFNKEMVLLIFIDIHLESLIAIQSFFNENLLKINKRWKSYSVLQYLGDHLHRFQYPACPIPCPKCHLEPYSHSSATFIELSCGKFQSFFTYNDSITLFR